MDWETPADAWYVWLAVSIVSVGLAGIVLGLPTGPPPDANQAANTIDRVAGTTHDASATYGHDAAEVKVEGPTVSLRNDHGTARSTLAYGTVVPVMGNERLEAIARGASLESAYGDAVGTDRQDIEGEFLTDLVEAHDETDGEWKHADGELAVRTLEVEAEAGTTVETAGSIDRAENAPSSFETTAATEATVRYTAASGTEIKVVLTGFEFAGHGNRDFDDVEHGGDNELLETENETDIGDGSQIDFEVPLTEHGESQNALVYPIAVGVYTDGSLECEGRLESSHGFADICEGGPITADIASDAAEIAQDAQSGEYRVTLVTA
ncbi:DUF7283 family protein [Natronorubrum tibetense]|uniref:Uncharacterized protein n=1 Tax=Natronorubrum tibetense GA33 TaxID=1114856 RepID=L9VDT9_9EURY|nr:hypothetical protein [Natronorubrum tibetense]ELY35244.1 hypothetical protein C496_23718 [Natronorubrum tibetense GA33]